MASLLPNILKALFIVLDILMVATLIYTLCTDGLPFRIELLTPWMATTLIDFYILTLGLAVWVAYKEPSCVCAAIWVILLICFGSITTCAFILVQLFKLSSQDAFQDPMYYLLVRHDSKESTERKRKFSTVVAARFLFGALSCLMLGALIYTILTDGTPFRKKLFTPWIIATLIDLYINIITLSVWVIYKESSWISAFVWIVLFICFGSVTICAYIVIQFFKLSPQDPLYLVLLKNNRSRQGPFYGVEHFFYKSLITMFFENRRHRRAGRSIDTELRWR